MTHAWLSNFLQQQKNEEIYAVYLRHRTPSHLEDEVSINLNYFNLFENYIF